MKLHLQRRFIKFVNVPCPERRIKWLPKVLSYKRIFIQPLLKMFEVHSFIRIHLLYHFFPKFDILLPQILVRISFNTYHRNVIRIGRKWAAVTKTGFRLIWVVAHGSVGRLGCFRTIIKTLRWLLRLLVGTLQIRIKHLNWAHLVLWLMELVPCVILAMIAIHPMASILTLVIRKCAKTWSIKDIL